MCSPNCEASRAQKSPKREVGKREPQLRCPFASSTQTLLCQPTPSTPASTLIILGPRSLPPPTDWTIRKILYLHTHTDRSNWLISWITLQSDGSDEPNLQALLESYRLLSEFTAVLNVLEGGSPLGAGFQGGLRHHGGL